MKQNIVVGNPPATLDKLLVMAQTPSLIRAPEEVANFFENLLEITSIAASQLAREINVTPQTVNRWQRGEVAPRSRQFEKISAFIKERMNEETANNFPLDENHKVWKDVEAASRLGIHFSDSIMALEKEAQHVWILKSGILREASQGYIGQGVLCALKNGVHYHYVFLAGTPAATSFVRLVEWLKAQEFTGSVTGYALHDPIWAGTLGITQVPGAWVMIEYGETQIHQLQRNFDVFMGLPAREYTDATRQHLKNEDGQPCWIELATSRADIWKERLHELRELTSRKKTRIKVTRILGRQQPTP